jgi:hypothetical protein
MLNEMRVNRFAVDEAEIKQMDAIIRGRSSSVFGSDRADLMRPPLLAWIWHSFSSLEPTNQRHPFIGGIASARERGLFAMTTKLRTIKLGRSKRAGAHV